MKRLIWFLSILLFASACKEEASQEENSFIFQGIVDQQMWSASSTNAAYRPSEKRFYLLGTRRHEKYYQEEQLRFSFTRDAIKPDGSVQNFDAELLHIVGGDAVSNSFAATSADPGNSLWVSRIDTVNNQLEGYFTLRLKRNSHWTKEEEYLLVMNGKFKIKFSPSP